MCLLLKVQLDKRKKAGMEGGEEDDVGRKEPFLSRICASSLLTAEGRQEAEELLPPQPKPPTIKRINPQTSPGREHLTRAAEPAASGPSERHKLLSGPMNYHNKLTNIHWPASPGPRARTACARVGSTDHC